MEENVLTIDEMVTAIYNKLGCGKPVSTPFGTPGKPSGGQIDPAKEVELPKVWNLYPKEGVAYPGSENCPANHHVLYNWNKDGEYIFSPDCGVIGG